MQQYFPSEGSHLYQLDIPRTSGNFFSIPKHSPGRVNTDDFVFFVWPHNFNFQDYTVVMSSNDVAGPQFRKIGPMGRQIELPYVHIDAYGTIGVIPTLNPNLPQFWGRLNRGSTYEIPLVSSPGKYTMKRIGGVLTSAVSVSNIIN